MHNKDIKQEAITALFILSCCLIVVLAFKTFLEYKYRETIKIQASIIAKQNQFIKQSFEITKQCQKLNKEILELKGVKK